MSTGVRIHLCGQLQVEVDGVDRTGEVRGRQGRAALAFLVLHRHRPVRRDELIEALAGPDGAAPGEGVLAPVLSRLRRALAPARLEGRGEVRLILPEQSWIDVEAARDALGRARTARDLAAARETARRLAGGLLPGLEAPWLDPARAEVADLRTEALELGARLALEIPGELAEAEADARAAVLAAPFRESARAVLIDVLRARGNVAEALRAFEEIRSLLREELGTPPGGVLLGLHRELLEADRPRPSDPAPAPALAEAAAPGKDDDRLEERARELGALQALLVDVSRGQGRVVILEGPAGIGKTRLLTELRDRARSLEMLVLGARASVIEAGFPFGVVRQLLGGVAAEDPGRAVLAGVRSPARTVFDEVGGGADTFAVLDGLHRLVLATAARRPVVLCVDDVQWADVPSVRLLGYLARRLENVRVLIAATLRTGEPSPDDSVLGEFIGDTDAMSLRPGALSVEAVGRLAAGRLSGEVAPAFAAACHEVTRGNPLLLRQLLVALADEAVMPDAARAVDVRAVGPRAVSRTVLLRLARLPPSAVSTARAVAVLGDRTALPVVADLARLDERDAATAVGLLARAEILRPERPLGFVHPLVREVVYAELSAAERDVEHARAARALHARNAGADEVAAHLLVGSPRGDAWVVDRLRAAARVATGRGAVESAVPYLLRALDEPPSADVRPHVLFELGLAESNSHGPQAVEHLRAALEEATDPELRGSISYELARALVLLGDPLAGRAVALQGLEGVPADLADVAQRLEAVALLSGALNAVPTHGTPWAGRLAGPEPGGLMLEAARAITGCVEGQPAEPCLAAARRSVADARLVKHDNGVFWFLAGVVLVLADQPGEAEVVWEWGLAEGERRGSLFTTLSARLWGGWTALTRGELDRAYSLLDEAIAMADAWGLGRTPASSFPLAYAALVRLERDELRAARTLVDGLPRTAEFVDGTRMLACSEVEVLRAEGRLDEAVELGLWLLERAGAGRNPGWGWERAVAARSLAAVGRREEAVALAREDLVWARRWGAAGVEGRALRLLGDAEGADGAGHLRLAVELLAPSPARLEHAKAVARLGMLAHGRDRHALLAQALAQAETLGAIRLAREVREARDLPYSATTPARASG